MDAVPEFPADRIWVRAVMATTLDGVMRGPDGGSRSISSAADQRWFAALRREPDVLLVGAGTIRAEDYRPSRAAMAVVSRSLHLPASLRMFAERAAQHGPVLLFTTDEAAASAPQDLRDRAEVIPCGSGAVDLARLIDELAVRGLRRIQCEGGPQLLGDLVVANLLDELFLTITPSLLGGGASEHLVHLPGGLDPAARLRLVDLQQDEGSVLMRLQAR